MTAIFQLPRAFPVVGDTVLPSGAVVTRALPGAKLEFYAANTTQRQDVFTNSTKSTKHTWPVVADATGKLPVIYLPSGVTLDAVLKTSAGATIDTYEDIPGDALDSGASATSVGRSMEVGAILWHSLQEVPLGWLRIKKSPQALNKSEYPELNAKYLAQGYPYGSTSTTFNIPGGAGLFPRIWDDTSTWDPDFAARKDHALGVSTVGNIIGSRQADQNAAHTHGPGSLSTSSAGAHTHNYTTRSAATAITQVDATNVPFTNTGTSTLATTSSGAHTHAVNAGATASSGSTESRPDNVAFPLIIFVNPAIAASVHSTLGLPYSFSTDITDTDPGAGYLKFDNVSPPGAANIFISKSSAFGADVSQFLDAISLVGGTQPAIFTVTNVAAMGNTAGGLVLGPPVDSGNYLKIPVQVTLSSGTFSADAKLSVQFGLSGQQGLVGASGPNSGLDYKWGTGVADTDPTNGALKVNNATLSAATFVYISKNGRSLEALGSVIDTWDSSNQATNKGALRIFAVADRTNYIEATVTGALVDATTYWKVPVTVQNSGGAFVANDILCVMFSRSGDTVAAPAIQSFTSSGTYTKTSGARVARIRGVAGGASGGGVSGLASNAAGASGGSAGGEFDFWLDVTAVTTETVTIGAGGAAPVAGANGGNAGGATSFGAWATANGGIGGSASVASTGLAVLAPTAGGTTTGLGGRVGSYGFGGVRVSGTAATSGSGGSSRFGTGGIGIAAAGSGIAGTGNGSGGSGGMSSAAVDRAGGAGAPGIVTIEEYF